MQEPNGGNQWPIRAAWATAFGGYTPIYIYIHLYSFQRNTMKNEKCKQETQGVINGKLVVTQYIKCSKQFRFQQETGNETLAEKQIGV